MRTNTLVQASADVITIVTLRPGDVYKRLHKVNSAFESDGAYRAQYGVVQTVDSNGEDTMITALEFTSDYTGVKPEVKVFGTESDVKLFAATPAEVSSHFDGLLEAAEQKVEAASRELSQARDRRDQVAAAVERAGELTAPEVVGAI